MFAYALKNKKHKDSSSGGAFPSLVDALFQMDSENNKISVYGVVLNQDKNIVHKRCTSKEECSEFKGSKYVFSNLGSTYQNVKADLENRFIVMFSGTPCQVAGLLSYLTKNNVNQDNLFTIDIICHGAPNHKVWHEYIKWIEGKYRSQIKEYSFRYSLAKWNLYPVMARFANGKKVVNSFYLRQYMGLFLKKITFRECCYSCKFSNMSRVSDITIGDFWGIEKVMPDFMYKSGVSEILVNSVKGKKLFNTVIEISHNNSDIVIQECFSNEYIKYQHNLNAPCEKPLQYDSFNKDFNEFGFEYVIKKYGDYSLKEYIKHCYRKIRAVVS